MVGDVAACSTALAEEIDEDLPQATGIRSHEDRPANGRDSDRRRLRQRFGDFDGIAHDSNEIDGRGNKLQTTGLDAAYLEEALDELPDLPGLRECPDGIGAGLRGGPGVEMPLDELKVPVQGGHRVLSS